MVPSGAVNASTLVMLQLGEVDPGSRLVASMCVVLRPGVRSEVTVASEEGLVPSNVAKTGDGEIMGDEGIRLDEIMVCPSEEGFVHETPSELVILAVTISVEGGL